MAGDRHRYRRLKASRSSFARPVNHAAAAALYVNRTIHNVINFCPPGTPIAARKALKNVLQSRRVYQPGRDRFFYSPGVTVPAADTPEAPSDLLAPEPAVRTGALIGYARVSTTGQLLDRQQVALAGAGCLRVFADKLSGKNADRPELTACLDYLRPGDILVVPSLDRLSRSLADLIGIVTTLRRRGVGLKSLHEALDTTTSGGRLVFHVFAALAEFIRELIVEGTREGLDAARASAGRRP